jgi:hypothetical protein
MHPLELQEKYLWAWKKFYSFRKRPLQSAIHRYVASKWHRANRGTLADLERRFERLVDWFYEIPFERF